jgi:putative ABC transport system permease protein
MPRRNASLTFFGMTWRNLYRQPVRSGLTAMGVAVGVIAVVTLGMVVEGFWVATNGAIRFSGNDITVMQAGIAADIFSSLDVETTRADLREIPEIESAMPVLFSIMPNSVTRFLPVFGLDPAYLPAFGQSIVEGRPFRAGANEVVIGRVAERMFKRTTGDRIQISTREFEIVGIAETEVVFFNGAGFIDLEILQAMMGREGKCNSFMVRVRDGVNRQAVVEEIERRYSYLLAIGSAEQYKKVDMGLEIARSMVTVVSLLALLIGGMIVANTMWMAVHERTREIGILRAVGWPRRRIIAMIVAEAIGIGVLAGIVGSLIGIGLAELLPRLPFTAHFFAPVYVAGPFLRAFGVSLALSVLGAAIPAWRAARISPAEALRYE